MPPRPRKFRECKCFLDTGPCPLHLYTATFTAITRFGSSARRCFRIVSGKTIKPCGSKEVGRGHAVHGRGMGEAAPNEFNDRAREPTLHLGVMGKGEPSTGMRA